MRTLSLFGLRVLSERSWNATIDDAARERARRCEVEEQLAKTLVESQEFASDVEKAATEGKEHNGQIRAAVSTVLECNVRLAHRCEAAELRAEQLHAELVKVLRTP